MTDFRKKLGLKKFPTLRDCQSRQDLKDDLKESHFQRFEVIRDNRNKVSKFACFSSFL